MTRSGSLYVFLHGLWVAREEGDNIEIALPRVSDHVYKAGSWLLETPIESDGVLNLVGVTAGSASFGRELIIYLPNCSLTPRRRFATLKMPRPGTILQLLSATPRPGVSYVVRREDPGQEQEWDKIATVQVLVYEYPDENEVALEGHYWEPFTTDRAMSLHIISTSEGPISLAHEAETTKALKRVIQGYPPLTFDRPVFLPAWVDNKSPGFGSLSPLKTTGNQFIVTADNKFAFSQAELEYISARTTRLGRLGRIKQQGRPLGGLWHEGDPLDDRLSNCQGFLVP